MSCEQIRPLLIAWLDGELLAEDTAEVERHLADCLSCTRLTEQYRDLLTAARPDPNEETLAQVYATDNGLDVWGDVEKRIQEERLAAETTEEIVGLRQELEQMQGIVRALQAEVARLRWQVNSQNTSQNQKARPLPGALMPGTQPAADTANLQFLL